MFDLGRWDELLATAREWRPRLEGGLGRGYLVQMEPYRAAVLCWRGSHAEAHRYLDPVLPSARKMALETLMPALAAAVTLSLAERSPGESLSLIEEYERALAPAAPASWYWGWTQLVGIVRACVALGELDRARRLAGAAQPSLWRHRLQSLSADAAIAEAAGDPGAEALYAESAVGWDEYGHALEQGLALLGLGRCRRRGSRHGGPAPLLAARAIFARLRAVSPLAETDSLLGHQVSRTS